MRKAFQLMTYSFLASALLFSTPCFAQSMEMSEDVGSDISGGGGDSTTYYCCSNKSGDWCYTTNGDCHVCDKFCKK